ncbi:expressed unknown protein [Seminavis robusta]|nr:expressed unknown protein [Seminavis robusta]|eukprot:Sro1557_g282250.1 n/a (261) ;mRNA; f:11454-12236
MMESCSSISMMDSCSTLGMSHSTLSGSGNGNTNNSPNKIPVLLEACKEQHQQVLAKRKRAMLRHSRSFDSTNGGPPQSFIRRPRQSKTRPRRHRSTPVKEAEPEEEEEEIIIIVTEEEEYEHDEPIVVKENRWDSGKPAPESTAARMENNSAAIRMGQPQLQRSSSHTSSSRWDTGTDSGHSRRSSTCPILPPSRQDSFTELSPEDLIMDARPTIPTTISTTTSTSTSPKVPQRTHSSDANRRPLRCYSPQRCVSPARMA